MIEVYDNYSSLGIVSRTITEGQEFDMVSEFINYRKDTFQESSEQKLAIFIETKVNNAYPDVVFAEYNPARFESWNSSRNKLTINDLKILHYIYYKKNVTSQQVIKDLSVKYKALLYSLEALIDAQLIDRKDERWIISDKSKIFGVNCIEAVEAKIGKWDIVMQQALVIPTDYSIPGDTDSQLIGFILTLMQKQVSKRPPSVKKALEWYYAVLGTLTL